MPSQDHPDSYFEDRSRAFSSPLHSPDTHTMILVPYKRRSLPRRLFWFTCLGLLLLVVNIGSTFLSTPQAYAAVRPLVVLKGAPSKPNTISPTAGSTSTTSGYHPAPEGSAPIGKPQAITHPLSVSMKAGSLALQANTTSHFLGSDGHLEVSIPANAVTTQDVQQAGGTLHFQVTEIAPPSGSNAGGSGHLSLGTYLFQLVDATGVLVNHGLHAPITVKYHYTKAEEALNLDHAYVVVNGPRPTQGNLIKFASTKANTALASTFGALSSQAVRLNTAQKTLLATPSINTPSTSLTWQSDVSIGTFGKPDPFNVDLSAGGLTSQLPIDVPAGPGGLTPPVSLNYSSEDVNNQHNPTGATGWVGEGWNLSMGSIDWAEHNVYAGCTTTACGGTANWENTWELSDPFGSSSELIPPNLNVSTYYDDTTNTYCDAAKGTNPPYPCPILWHTATETHTKIYAYVGPNSLPDMSAKPPCFRVWEPNGVMEEYGCTPDSLQHYYQASVGAHLVSSWLLDLITDPQGNQIHFTYQQDNTTVAGTHQAIRDVALSTIEYDSPNCHNAQVMCTGSNWNPLVRLSFQANHAPRLSGVAPSGCNTGANLRCDDPLDLSSSGGIAAPEVESTFVLNDILVQVRTNSSASWNTLHDYRLGYEESGPTTITDPSTGKQESTAGMLDLTQFQDIGTAGANALTYSGMDNSTTKSFAYMKVFDLSSKNIVVGPNTTLSYWIYPQSSATTPYASGSNSTCVAVDMLFTDGSDLRDSGAVDQHGNKLHPASQCGHLTMDQWNLVTSNIGPVRSGKTISQILVGYDQAANTGDYHGYLDDLSLSDPTSTTPLFATAFESGDPQPTWVSTGADGGGITNIGGICCGLTGPEMDVRQEVVRPDRAVLPMRTFTYSSALTNYYEDDQFTANSSGISKCGPSWNTGNGSGCLLWSQSYANNNRFLAMANNGQGLVQTFGWALARSNTHGVPGGGANNADTFYCNTHQSGYPCNEADDQSWSHIVLVQEKSTTVRLTQNGQGGTQTATPINTITDYSYLLSYPLASQQCKDCVAGFYWGNQNDSDYLSYYNNKFMGFAQATINLPDNTKEVHKYYATQGIGIYDTSQVTCSATSPCHASPWWNLNNAAHGHEYQALYYDTDKTTLLKQTNNTYKAVCPPAGVAPTPASTDAGKTYTWDGNLVSELDHNNPVAVCDIQETQSVSQVSDGTSSNVSTTTAWTYDNYGRVTQTTTSANGGTPSKVVKNTSYVWNDGVTATRTSATGTYIIDTPAFTDTEDGSGNRLACSYTSYDGQSYTTGQSSKLTGGLETTATSDADCGTASNNYTPSGPSTTTTVYDVYGNIISATDADANAGISGHTGCILNTIQYTKCATYDTTFDVFQTSSTNVLNQTSSTSYSNTGALFGFGTWTASTTDVNKQTTRYTYDSLGRMTGEVLPGETSGDLTKQWAYTDWCSGTSAQSPCVEIDEIDRLDSGTTTTTRAFYDGEGRLVETRAPGPNSQDVVTYAYYDQASRQIFKSNPYFVAAYTSISGLAAYSIPDSTQPGTSTSYPNSRQTSVTDPNSHTTATTESIVCGVSGTSDTGCYTQTMTTDANGHEKATLAGGLGETNYSQTYTGNSSTTFTLYATTKSQYNAANDLLSTVAPDGSTTTSSYNDLGLLTSQIDPDNGTTSATYDPNSNLTETVDARGNAGTIYMGYDGLNRLLWRNKSNSSSGAWVTDTYDSTANSNMGVGKLTGESFLGSGGLSGSYTLTYDARGQEAGSTVTVNGTAYSTSMSYNDVGQATNQTYPTGEVVAAGYSSTGWMTGLTTSAGGTTTLASNLSYSGLAGAAGRITTMSLDNGVYSYSANYDTGLRLTGASVTSTSNGTSFYQTQPTYDSVNNIVGVQTSVGGQTDTQQFCYDDLYRLTWSGTNGTPPCSGQSITAGTLTAAQYQQSETYNVDGGLMSGPAGTYTYGDTTHPHAVTTTSNGYSAAYDAAGNMTCRALTSATTCGGSSPTGQQLSYNEEGWLSAWQNQPTLPTQTVNYLYDGSGNRVAMQSTVNGVTTLTAYIGSIEEVQTTGSSTQTTTYYSVGGKRVAADVNGTFYYFGYDALGSQVAVLNSTGSLIGAQLYGPYGSSRYSTGILPTSIGFTGQQSDSTTGLDYYIARYYDPVIGAFLSVDSVQGNTVGMDPYAYVSGNPETLTDPTGHCAWWDVSCDVQVVGKAVQSFGGEAASDAGSWFGDAGSFLGGALETAGEWLGPIGIGVAVVSFFSHSTRLGCGCVTTSTSIHSSVKIGDIAHRVDNPKKAKTADILDKIRTDSKAEKDATTTEGKERDKANYGGAYLQLGNEVNGVFVPNAGYVSLPLVAVPGDDWHVEDQATDWAIEVTNLYRAEHPGSISAVRLDIYTFKAPCALCADWYSKSRYVGDIAEYTGIVDVDVRIWTSSNNPGNGIKPAKY